MGYPPDFKSKRKHTQGSSHQANQYQNEQNNAGTTNFRNDGSDHTRAGNFRPYANNATANNSRNAVPDKQGESPVELSNEELDQVRNLLHNRRPEECKANLAGNVSLNIKSSGNEWIIDSRATHHITSCKRLLHDLKQLKGSNTVQVPTRKQLE